MAIEKRRRQQLSESRWAESASDDERKHEDWVYPLAQLWWNLRDPAMEKELHKRPVHSQLVGVDGAVCLPDEGSILRFRDLLNSNQLALRCCPPTMPSWSMSACRSRLSPSWTPPRAGEIVQQGSQSMLVELPSLK